jgi:GR25 family glycosyltransferase involved in LPS biosynthesis
MFGDCNEGRKRHIPSGEFFAKDFHFQVKAGGEIMSNTPTPPKKFVISTEIYHERLKDFLNQQPAKDAQVILGMNALKVPSNPELLERVRDGVSGDCTWPMGSICCGLAHFEVLQECIRTNEPVSIFEDDAILREDFDEKSTDLINQIEGEWDIIQWGFNWDSIIYFRLMGKEGPVCHAEQMAELEKFDFEKFKKSTDKSQLFPLVSTFGMHAYTVSPVGAKKILEFFPKISNHLVDNFDLLGVRYWCSSVDMVLNSFYNTNNAFISIPPLSYVVNDKTTSAIWNPPS